MYAWIYIPMNNKETHSNLNQYELNTTITHFKNEKKVRGNISTR